MADYWTKWLPKMCKELKAEGTLYKRLKKNGDKLLDEQIDLMQRGLAEDGAWEIVKEEIFSLKPER